MLVDIQVVALGRVLNTAKTMDSQDWGLLVLLSILWGGAYFFAGVAVGDLPPLTVVLARVSLAALVLLPLFWYARHSMPRSATEWLPFFVMGLLNNVIPFGLIFFGQTSISVRLSSIINAITCLLYTSPSPRARQNTRMPSSA